VLTANLVEQWVGVCPLSDLVPGRGVAAIIDGVQVAIFLVGDQLFAVSNRDPFSGANVVSRGVVGTTGDVLKVASPMYKQAFDLRSGKCIDEPTVALETFGVRATDGAVEVAFTPVYDAH
jgi:nitrite reductase (NADH) small subunit